MKLFIYIWKSSYAMNLYTSGQRTNFIFSKMKLKIIYVTLWQTDFLFDFCDKWRIYLIRILEIKFGDNREKKSHVYYIRKMKN